MKITMGFMYPNPENDGATTIVVVFVPELKRHITMECDKISDRGTEPIEQFDLGKYALIINRDLGIELATTYYGTFCITKPSKVIYDIAGNSPIEAHGPDDRTTQREVIERMMHAEKGFSVCGEQYRWNQETEKFERVIDVRRLVKEQLDVTVGAVMEHEGTYRSVSDKSFYTVGGIALIGYGSTDKEAINNLWEKITSEKIEVEGKYYQWDGEKFERVIDVQRILKQQLGVSVSVHYGKTLSSHTIMHSDTPLIGKGATEKEAINDLWKQIVEAGTVTVRGDRFQWNPQTKTFGMLPSASA